MEMPLCCLELQIRLVAADYYGDIDETIPDCCHNFIASFSARLRGEYVKGRHVEELFIYY